MQIPIASLSASLIVKFHKIPKYQELLTIISESSFFDDIDSFLKKYLVIDNTQNLNLSYFNEYYEKEINYIINRLPDESFSKMYLVLQKDYETLKGIVLFLKQNNQEFGKDNFVKVMSEISDKLVYNQDFKKYLSKKEYAIERSVEVYGLIAYLEEIYLTILSEKFKDAPKFFQNYLEAKINTYYFMSAIKRTELGQSKDHILNHIISIPGVFSVLEKMTFGDIVGEIGEYLRLPIEQINVINIEKTLLMNEVKAINQANYLGLHDEKILQYIVTLKYFGNNIKLAYLKKSIKLHDTELFARMIDYNFI